jgi:hypothetical protein
MKHILGLVVFLFLSGCATTAMYTSPSPINSQSNIYNFSIETGGFAGDVEADARATDEIKKFMSENGYRQYKILNRTNMTYFSGFKYTVQFYK